MCHTLNVRLCFIRVRELLWTVLCAWSGILDGSSLRIWLNGYELMEYLEDVGKYD